METEEKVQEKKTEPSLVDILSNFPDAPVAEQIDEWKKAYGEIFCSGFTNTELFIWRTITRKEYVALQVKLSQTENVSQSTVEEEMTNLCTLWGSPGGLEALDKKAGTLSTLHEQIMQNSNFVNPAMASALVIKL